MEKVSERRNRAFQVAFEREEKAQLARKKCAFGELFELQSRREIKTTKHSVYRDSRKEKRRRGDAKSGFQSYGAPSGRSSAPSAVFSKRKTTKTKKKNTQKSEQEKSKKFRASAESSLGCRAKKRRAGASPRVVRCFALMRVENMSARSR